MPNRIIREGWLESVRIDELDAAAERFFLRLCLKADDFGRFHATPQLLKSLLFPLKEDIRNTDTSRCLAACEKAGLVRCYEVTGKRYLEISNFGQRLRAKRGRFPDMSGMCPTHAGHMPGVGRLEEKRREVEVEESEKGSEAFVSLAEAEQFFAHEFPKIPIKHSLTELIKKRGKNALTEAYCRKWLSNEERRNKRKISDEPASIKDEPCTLEQQSEFAAELAKLKSQMNGNRE